MYQTLNLRWSSAVPMLMHSGRLSDPLDPHARALKVVSGRRTKTESDFEEMARIEHVGGLWLDEDGPCIPGEVAEAVLQAGARRTKQGKAASAGVICGGNYPLEYDGPRDPEGLWADDRFRLRVPAKVGTGRVIRTRPIFRAWACTIAVEFNADLVNRDDVVKWARTAGLEIGVGDWRPKFGRFTVEAV